MSDPIRDVELHGELPKLNRPILIVMLQGWIDAAGAANDTMSLIEGQIDPLPVATFDPDVFIDFERGDPPWKFAKDAIAVLIGHLSTCTRDMTPMDATY